MLLDSTVFIQLEHDRLIAATALAHGWRLATNNARHFAHVQGLDIVELDLS